MKKANKKISKRGNWWRRLTIEQLGKQCFAVDELAKILATENGGDLEEFRERINQCINNGMPVSSDGSVKLTEAAAWMLKKN